MWKNTVINFDKRRSLNCVLLAEELAAGTYRKRAPIRFDIHERGKLRRISAVSFRDRVVQRALCDNSLVPIVSGQLIHDNGASLLGKGTTFARRRFELHLGQALGQWERPCMAVFDCSDYFGSIDSTRAFQMIRERYLSIARTEHERRDTERILRILELFVRDEPHLGLGNQTSQTMAVWYLDRADHWAPRRDCTAGTWTTRTASATAAGRRRPCSGDMRRFCAGSASNSIHAKAVSWTAGRKP